MRALLLRNAVGGVLVLGFMLCVTVFGGVAQTFALDSTSPPSGDINDNLPTNSVCNDNLGTDVGNSAVCGGAQKGAQASNDPFFGPTSLVGKIIQAVIFLVGALSVIMVVYGGFRYVTSGGDSNSTKGAKDTILYAIIGLVIAIFAQTIVSFVITRKIL